MSNNDTFKKNTIKLVQDYNLNTLPHDEEAEETLLGSLLSDNSSLDLIENGLSNLHFFVPIYGRIYQSICELIYKDQIANPLTLEHYFSDDDAFKELGGKDFLNKLCDGNLGKSIIKDYATLLKELYNKRELIKLSKSLELEARKFDHDKKSLDIIEETEAQLYELTEDKTISSNQLISFKESVEYAMESAKNAHLNKGQTLGVSSGYLDLDNLLGGLHKSDLLILAGRPSMGKTALATNIAFKISSINKDKKIQNVAFFSLEMSAEQLANRILAEQTTLSSDKIRRGKLSKEDFASLNKISKDISNSGLYIDDTPAITIPLLRTRARRLKRKLEEGISLIVVDYLQLMRGTKKFENRVLEISEITQGLKSIAKELDVPVLALSQLSRAVEQREDKRPQLSDLRESGTIEQDSDVVMFIYRQEYYEERAEPKSSGTETSVAFTERYIKWQENLENCKNIADIIIAKQRHGPIGSLQLHFDSKLTKFSNLADDKQEAKKI
ncbi:MAG: Replicative DNA helicase [Alphaproteobacteria bacterium MarineAlpha9_Bin4]|nr:replicative DNA helicase [Pelagibacterales bacterium]PPR25686.1 MAG: Replicative DNA helicase [Alphaproteobacteria bacterium MarineAlpha9_Bin4]|tara:strand:+ start:167 stop:1663 length:1497 start_codon:yes stop_codon:yes gene_type:complete